MAGSRVLRCFGLVLGLGLLAPVSGRAQAAGSYVFTPASGTFTPTVGGTAVPAILHDETVSGSLPIGFTFTFGGVGYTSFQVSSNGLLGFGGDLSTVGGELTNTLTSSRLTGGSLPVLAPFFTDLYGGQDSEATAQYALAGTAPNRVLTMEWLDFTDLNGDAKKYLSFQVKLYETGGRIEYVYRRGPAGEAGDATIGLKGTDGSFLALSNVGTTPTTSSTVSTNRLNRPATGQVYAFAPAAGPLAATAPLAAAEVTVFPNPTHAAFTVQVPAVAGSPAVRAELLNTLGQVVRSQTAALPAAGTRLTVATTDLAAGIYTLRLRAGAATVVKRVVLQ